MTTPRHPGLGHPARPQPVREGVATTRRDAVTALAALAATCGLRARAPAAEGDGVRAPVAAPTPSAADRPPEQLPERALRRVADHVVRGTTRRLVDRVTGQTFDDSTGFQPRPELSIESKFNAWFHQNWLLADGMRRVAAVLDEPAYRDYGEQNLDFIYRHMPYFTRQHDAGMQATPVGDGRLSPIAFHFDLAALWQTGLAPLVQERHATAGERRYEPYLGRLERFLAGAARFDDGAFYRPGKGLMADDAFMTVPVLVRRFRATGDEADLDAAVAQVQAAHARIFDEDRGLFHRLWDLRTQRPQGAFFGRGNGWMALAQVEVLAALPADHPRRGRVLAAYRRHMAGIDRCADLVGGWHQVLDRPDSWIETSATGILTYALARGVNEGWLDRDRAATARQGWGAVGAKILPDGDLADVCGSTDTGNVDYYLNRPRLQGDLHGFGSVLLAGAEIIRLERG
jgi:rhamnogalacturonyl hydrolase YesR